MKKSANIYRTAVLMLLLVMPIAGVFSQNYPQLSENATISLMTCGQGSELYSTFGHSALLVQDIQNRIDRVYNYGTFDFNDPNFYFLFVRGIANYKLSLSNSQSFMREYMLENRTVEQQVLNLTLEQKQRLFELVEENYKPENRYYRYDFLFLNCSSIIRDRVFEVLDKSYILDSTHYEQSFRDLLQPYIPNEWLYVGINLLLGPRADRQASNWQRMFLPDHMRDQFALTKISSADGELLAQHVRSLYKSTQVRQLPDHLLSTPQIVFLVLLIITGIFTRKKYNTKPWNKPFDTLIFFVSGIIGLLLTFMWFLSKHDVINENINLLWAFPLHLIIAVLVWFGRLDRIVRVYAKAMFVAIILFFFLAAIGIQEIPTTLLIFSGVVMLRLFRLAFFRPIIDQV